MSSKKRILVTGASGGIGSAIVKTMASPDSLIGIHYNANKAGAEVCAEKAGELGADTVLLPADLSTEDGRSGLVSVCREKLGGCDILVNNAGGPVVAKSFSESSEGDIFKTFGVNFVQAVVLCQAFFGEMLRQNYGRIINISSCGIKFGGGETSFFYSAAKASLELLTVNLARKGATKNVLVNTVRAGVIDTDLHEKMLPGKNMEQRIELIPVKRMGRPEEVADMVAYLAGEKATFITGQTFSVTGGE